MKLIFTTVFLFLSISLFAQFRDSKWGQSIQEVKRSETAELIGENSEGLVYNGTLGSINVRILYYFQDDKLVLGGYENLTTYFTGDYYVRDFNKWNDSLVKKYGQPKLDNTYIDSDYKDEPGAALLLGKAGYNNQWLVENTLIDHSLTHADFEFSHLLYYSDISYIESQQDNDNGF